MAKLKAAVLLNHPECSLQSAHGVVKVLSSLYGISNVDCIKNTDLVLKKLSKYQLLAVPGGLGDSDTWHRICEPYLDQVQQYVLQGGHYLGICMGAYWAGPLYFDLASDINPVQYIRRPGASVHRSYSTVVDVTWMGHNETMFFYDGCSLLGAKPSSSIASYTNGDCAALIEGRIGLIGPHPESDSFWYMDRYMRRYWHHYTHHALLADFVRLLVNKL
ncbi:MAG: hypothetical protein EBT86_00495 [Actinobacteria bacterium]|nr:hypothetical protein [Actinomycetota bacterium]NDC04320.1 hypothetical protein [Betaproteobacteria bacterium]NDG83290.1 hypothetical protein [Betaproteobacteria bacterium]